VSSSLKRSIGCLPRSLGVFDLLVCATYVGHTRLALTRYGYPHSHRLDSGVCGRPDLTNSRAQISLFSVTSGGHPADVVVDHIGGYLKPVWEKPWS